MWSSKSETRETGASEEAASGEHVNELRTLAEWTAFASYIQAAAHG